jgi:hypothetical protein
VKGIRAGGSADPAAVAAAVESDLSDVPTGPVNIEGAQAGPAESSPAISSGGLDWEESEPSAVIPAAVADNLAESGAVATTNRPPGQDDLGGWSESLVGWIPEESRMGPLPTEKSKLGLIIAAGVAALVVGGGGIVAAVVMSGDDDPEEVAKAPEAEPVAKAPEPQAQPVSEHEPEIMLDDQDLVLDDEDLEAYEKDHENDAAGAKPETKTTRKKKDTSTAAPPAFREKVPSGPVVNLNAGMVRREIAQNMFHVHRCYDQALKRNPNLAGRYAVTITISLGGRVSRVVIDKDTLRHPGVANCVKRKIRAWRFPIKGRLSHATEVSFPVRFKT